MAAPESARRTIKFNGWTKKKRDVARGMGFTMEVMGRDLTRDLGVKRHVTLGTCWIGW
jgi:hypothetical protein